MNVFPDRVDMTEGRRVRGWIGWWCSDLFWVSGRGLRGFPSFGWQDRLYKIMM